MSMGDEKNPGRPDAQITPGALSATGCALVLITAFLGWMCAGWQLAISSIAMRDAVADLLGSAPEPVIANWFGRLTTAFLLGAAFGGYVFGWVGDRFGRARAMALSIIWYSVFSGATVLVTSPEQLAAMRFVTCMGVGGMWPNGIALVSEAWPNISRPILAGAIGTAANFGIMMVSAMTANYRVVKVGDWHWIMWFGATPVWLGLFTLLIVPESPRWQAATASGGGAPGKPPSTSLLEIFRPPLLATTTLGIALGTIPLFGGWGCSNWVMPWAAQVGAPELKAQLQLARSFWGTVSSLLGGGLALLIGRRLAYFLASLTALTSGLILFCFLTPDGNPRWFLFWFGALGFFSGFFFGWLPLCLPELFPTRVRSTGAGVSFNWGRIATAVGVLVASEALRLVNGNYALIGGITSLVYALGMIVILFVPDTSKRQLDQ
jgi:SHS family sialic acid transporter-like MFS transporter